ncbi:hypothetical protein PR202_gb25657 [Eleusine coracana subsp. coracana]|uniref:Uncharacterized protein n=1 Tax=Eleusine coracana subsp. coracana TaxID=191504 RepID=A0AAV5FLT6_ELECO|nr:hypothetical protein PR202_gb25657 [Eleusine coracana subsp. coracana]
MQDIFEHPQPARPAGAFAFLKQGVVALPARGYRVFAQAFALDAVLSLPLLLAKHVVCGGRPVERLPRPVRRRGARRPQRGRGGGD